MTLPATLRFSLKPADYIAAQMAHMRSSTIWYLMLFVGCVNLAFAISALIRSPGAVPAYAMPGFVGLFFTVGFPLLIRASAPSAFRSNPRLTDEMSLTIDDEGIKIESASASGKERWSGYSAYRASSSVFALYHGARAFRIIPRAAFASEEQAKQFEQLLAEKIGKIRRSLLM